MQLSDSSNDSNVTTGPSGEIEEPPHSVGNCDDDECEICRQWYLEQEINWWTDYDRWEC